MTFMMLFSIFKSFRENEKEGELLRKILNQEFVLLVGCLDIIFQITNYSLMKMPYQHSTERVSINRGMAH